MAKYGLFLVAPDDLSWAAVRLLLRSMPDVCVLRDATDALGALHADDVPAPDAIVSSPDLRGAPALPVLETLQQRWPDTRIVLLVSPGSNEDLNLYARLPAMSCLSWSDLTPSALRHSLLALLDAPLRIFSESVTEGSGRLLTAGSSPGDPSIQVPDRAVAILGGLAGGLTEREIAVAKGMSLRTVKRVIADLESQLDAPSLFSLALAADRCGLLPSAAATPSRLPERKNAS